jgi:hypothetical protein
MLQRSCVLAWARGHAWACILGGRSGLVSGGIVFRGVAFKVLDFGTRLQQKSYGSTTKNTELTKDAQRFS